MQSTGSMAYRAEELSWFLDRQSHDNINIITTLTAQTPMNPHAPLVDQ